VTAAIVVCNSSPLIAFSRINELHLLEQLFGSVSIPPAVSREISPPLSLPPWIVECPLTQSVGPQILNASLGMGESEAISLALENGAAWVILDDRPARRLAIALRLQLIGTLGILLAGKRRGFLATIKPHIEQLTAQGFYIAPRLQERVLTAANELS
jgi:uncharacterized protein